MVARLAVYIPNLNGGDRLRRALSSLARQTVSASVVVIDNGSKDGSPEFVRGEFGEVNLVELGENVGFGRALNVGVDRHPADVLVFLNNDVECEPRFLEALVDALRPEAGMAAGVLVQRDRPKLIDSAGVVADRTLLAFDYLHGEPIEKAEAAPPPLGPTGGAAVYRRGPFEAAGGFDPRIFAYLEDVDLALRLRVAGVRCAIAPGARAIHAHSATLGSGSPAKNRLMGWSRGYLLRRYGILSDPRRAPRALAGELVISAGQLVVDGNAAGIAARLRGWRAAGSLPRRRLPDDALSDISLPAALRRRASRRRAVS
jgi:N-acetylglucosaminyl-diphospho-decaprenol L-rhamnosyltransferase